jgi:hypothetical protein
MTKEKTILAIMVPKTANAVIGTILAKKFALLSVNPASNIIGGKSIKKNA